jgi:hypothetical protein
MHFKALEISCHGVLVTPSRHLPGATEENQEESQSE